MSSLEHSNFNSVVVAANQTTLLTFLGGRNLLGPFPHIFFAGCAVHPVLYHITTYRHHDKTVVRNNIAPRIPVTIPAMPVASIHRQYDLQSVATLEQLAEDIDIDRFIDSEVG